MTETREALDWKRITHACGSQLWKRGISDPDRTQDAVFFVFNQIRRGTTDPLPLIIWRAAAWTAEGRSPCRDNPPGYVDATHPADVRKRFKLDQTAARRRQLIALGLADPDPAIH